MHYNLTADDYDVEIGELVDQYRTADAGYGFGVFDVQRFVHSGTWKATIHVDARFTGEYVTEFVSRDGKTFHIIYANGSDLCEALRNVRNRFVSAAPALIAKGA